MKVLLLVASILLAATTVVAAELEVPIAVDVQSEDAVLRSTARLALASRIRSLPNVRIVSDNPLYIVQVLLRHIQGNAGHDLGWTGSFVVTSPTDCGGATIPWFRYAGILTGADEKDADPMMLVVANEFDEHVLTPDRENWRKNQK